MRIAAIQICCKVGDVTANLNRAERLVESASVGGAEFVCLPELFTTGIVFGKMDKLAELIPGPTTQKLSRIARTHSVYLVAGMVERREQTGTLHNASLLHLSAGRIAAKIP